MSELLNFAKRLGRRSLLSLLVPAACLVPFCPAAAGDPDHSSEVGLPDRWRVSVPGHSILWDVANDTRLPHKDNVELGGKRTTAIVFYTIDAERKLQLKRAVLWPSLRIAPNNTYGSLKVDFTRDEPPRSESPLSAEGLACFEPSIKIDGTVVIPRVRRVHFENGLLILTSDLGNHLSLNQTCTPSVEGMAYCEKWQVIADSPAATCRVEITPLSYSTRLPYSYVDKGIYRYGEPRPSPTKREGDYHISIRASGASAQIHPGTIGPVCASGVFYRADETLDAEAECNIDLELAERAGLAANLFSDMQFECPDPVLRTLFNVSKLRACDSICATRHGPLHAPGGGCYYAAIWANDTIEYVGPFFPLLGYDYANEATLNALEHYARYLNPEYNPLPSSIIAEGTDIWARRLKPDGLPAPEGDCGDAAMLAFGTPRFLLALGDRTAALKYWPIIEWSLEYCHRRTTSDGVIESASDELEGRFSSGHCNLNTSMLTYGGLLSAADLAHELGKPGLAHTYRKRAHELREAAAKYFEADIAGFSTYQYHQGCKELRAWMCMPLTMGIFERKRGTIDALFSPRLWTFNGLLTADNSSTYWDRSALHALRGTFNAGEPDTALLHLQQLSHRRLLGEHVPYVIEAVPEGNGRHLSGESALYCRVVTEGLFGFVPRGFRSLTLQPELPSDWNQMALRRVKAFQSTFDVQVSREELGHLKVIVSPENREPIEMLIKEGGQVGIHLPGN
jgi:hypothetical protein